MMFPKVIEHPAQITCKCISGSQAYGLSTDDSDADLHWALGGSWEQVKTPVTQECYRGLVKFLQLVLADYIEGVATWRWISISVATCSLGRRPKPHSVATPNSETTFEAASMRC
jgi:hypothetical protein